MTMCEGILIGRLLARKCGSGCTTLLGGPTAGGLRSEQWQNLDLASETATVSLPGFTSSYTQGLAMVNNFSGVGWD